MYDDFDYYDMYKTTYRRGMPYGIQENINNSYGYLAEDLDSSIGYGMQTPYWYEQMRVGNINNMENLEEMYPEIYKVVYPMVKKACNRNTRSLNKNLIEEMAEEIYSNLEENNEIRLNINLENDIGEENRSIKETENNQIREEENRGKEHRNRKRGTLFDLIKILLIRELIDRRPDNRPRPPRPPMPPRPGYPGRPPMLRY